MWDQQGVAELEIYLKDKAKYEQQVKIEIIKLVKIELGFPGIKIEFLESEFVPEGEKAYEVFSHRIW